MEVLVDRWQTHVIPILRYVADRETEMTHYTTSDLAEAVGLDHREVSIEVDRLIEGGYISANPSKFLGSDPALSHLIGARLTARGARALRLWPPEDAYDAFEQYVEEQMAASPDEETRSKLRQLLGVVRDVGTNFAGGVLAGYVQRMPFG